MKKLTALISALALLLALCACSGQAAGGAKSGDASPEPGSASYPMEEGQDAGAIPPVTPVVEPNAPKPDEEVQPPDTSEPPADASAFDPAPEPPPALSSKPGPTQRPSQTQRPDQTQKPPQIQKPDQTQGSDPAEEPAPNADPKATAQSLIGRPVSELYAAIGKPISSDYAPGCLEPDSEDGELVYSGFTVYTVRTAAREYVYDVL